MQVRTAQVNGWQLAACPSQSGYWFLSVLIPKGLCSHLLGTHEGCVQRKRNKRSLFIWWEPSAWFPLSKMRRMPLQQPLLDIFKACLLKKIAIYIYIIYIIYIYIYTHTNRLLTSYAPGSSYWKGLGIHYQRNYTIRTVVPLC